MTGSSSAGFPWTPTTTEIAHDTIWRVMCHPRDDPFKENNLVQAASKLHARPVQSTETAPLQYVTTNDLTALLHSQRQLYHRAFPGDAELIGKEIPHFYLFMFFSAGVPPGSRRRRRTSSNRRGPGPSTTSHPEVGGHGEDDDFMPPRRSPSSTRGRPRTIQRGRSTNSERRRTPATTIMQPNDDADDDDFMPDEPLLRRRPPPGGDTDDEEIAASFHDPYANIDFSASSRRRRSSYPDNMYRDASTERALRKLHRDFNL